MQKYEQVEGEILKLKPFPFSLRGRAKQWLLSLPKIVLIHELNAKMFLLENTILLLRLYN